MLTAALVEEAESSVVVTWGLGEALASAQEFFGYEVYYYGPDGNGGKRFGVRFGSKVTAYVWDHASNTQANYGDDCVEVRSDSVIVRYRDADLGLARLGTILAYSHVDGVDEQLEVPVTVLR